MNLLTVVEVAVAHPSSIPRAGAATGPSVRIPGHRPADLVVGAGIRVRIPGPRVRTGVREHRSRAGSEAMVRLWQD